MPGWRLRELMLVVKDDAYGHGLDRIVRRAAAEGVGWFGAFDVREALRTREAAGAEARILSWLTVGAEEIAEALAADIDLGVGDAALPRGHRRRRRRPAPYLPGSTSRSTPACTATASGPRTGRR